MISQFNINFEIDSPIGYSIGKQSISMNETAKLYIPLFMTLIEKDDKPITKKISINSSNTIFINDESCKPITSRFVNEDNYIEIENRSFNKINLENNEKVFCYTPINTLNNMYF